jgi:hypothetical protein
MLPLFTEATVKKSDVGRVTNDKINPIIAIILIYI